MTAPVRTRDERTAVDKAISVITAFSKDPHAGLGVSELARRTSMSKSTTFRILSTLERNSVIERVGTAYRLGRVIQDLGAPTVRPEHERARDVLTPYLADLYAETRLTAQLAVLDGAHVVYLNKLEGQRRLRTPSRIGGRMPAYCTGVGKALLAYDPEALERTLHTIRHAWTSTTITAAEELHRELDLVRQRGIAIDHGESVESLTCIAIPVIGPAGKPVAAFSLSGDSTTFVPAAYESLLRRVSYSASREYSRTRLTAVA